MEGLVPLLPIVGAVLIFWLLLIRPGVRRERERRTMQESLAVGDRIILTSGFFGTISALRDDRADVELAPGTTVTVALGAVGGLDPSAAAPAEPGDPSAPDLSKTPTTTHDASAPSSEPEES